ncbi:unnamed protein product, partial [Iphiclides podalirius]
MKFNWKTIQVAQCVDTIGRLGASCEVPHGAPRGSRPAACLTYHRRCAGGAGRGGRRWRSQLGPAGWRRRG